MYFLRPLLLIVNMERAPGLYMIGSWHIEKMSGNNMLIVLLRDSTKNNTSMLSLFDRVN
jgi:hypothetical protein